MATISTLVAKSTTAGQRFFTAPFDCIVGIHMISGSGIGGGGIGGGGTLYLALSGQSSLTEYITIAPHSQPAGTKITNIIMKQGDSFVFQYDHSYIKVHITGVSA